MKQGTQRREWFELLLYSFTLFHFCCTISHRFNLRKTRKSETVKEGIWYHLKLWKNPHLPALRFHNNGRLSVFLPFCFPLLTVYKYWQNLDDSVEVSLNPSSFCAPFFCLMFFVSLFTFCFLCCGWLLWLLWFLIGALAFGLILTEAAEILPIDCLLIYMDW